MIDLVTGANGFIGKHLMEKLDSDALSIEHDRIHDTVFSDCDRFFFLSTYGNMAGQDDLSEILRANIGNLGYVLASYIEESSCDHFTFVSSSSVNLPVQTPYSHAKRAAEEMVLASGIRACVVRPYSVTGVGEQPQHLIPTLIRSCMENESVILTTEPVHDFVDVQDLTDFLITLSENKAIGIHEFGSGVPTTNEEVLSIVEQACGKQANVEKVATVAYGNKYNRPYDTDDWFCRQPPFFPGRKSLKQSISEMVEAYNSEHA